MKLSVIFLMACLVFQFVSQNSVVVAIPWLCMIPRVVTHHVHVLQLFFNAPMLYGGLLD